MKTSTFVPRCPKCRCCKIALHPKEEIVRPQDAQPFHLNGAYPAQSIPVFCIECSWCGNVTEVSYERI